MITRATEKINRRHKIGLHSAISLVSLFILCIPVNETAFGILWLFIRIVQVPIFLWSTYIFVARKIYNNKWLFPLWLLFLVFIICTIVEQPDYSISVIIYAYRFFCITVLSDFLLKKNISTGIYYIAMIWAIFMLINTFSYFTHCFGTVASDNINIVNNYFFGIRNDINQYIIYTIAFVWLAYSVSDFSKSLAVITTIAAIVFVIGERVSSSIVGLSVFVFVYIVGRIIRSQRVWRSLIIVLGAFIILLTLGQTTQFFTWIVQDVLNKDVTMSGRTVIWMQAISQMTGSHWLFGYGYNPPFNFTYVVNYTILQFNHPHNQYLQMLYNFGIGGLALYIILIIRMIKQVKPIKDQYIRKLHLATLISTLVMCISSRNFLYYAAPMYYVVVLYLPQYKAVNSSVRRWRLKRR